MISLRRRLSWALASSLVLVALALLQTSLWLFESGLRRHLAGQLRDEAEGLLGAIVRLPDGSLQLEPSRINPRYQRAFSGHYFRIQLPDRTWRSRSLWDAEPAWPARPGLAAQLIDGPQAQHLLSYRGDYRRGDLPVVIQVAQDYTPILDSFAQVRTSGLVLLGFALLLLLLLQRYAMRRALQPLERVRRQIEQLQQGARRQLEADVPEELRPLVAQINHLLGHTEATLQRSRHALGNLGHSLKTPLAVLHALLQREELTAHPQLHAGLLAAIHQIDTRVASELSQARLAGAALPGAFFDCERELPALCEALATIHRPGPQLSWQAPPGCRLPWDREDLLEVLGNLLDNACKWAAQRVRLEIQPQGDGWRLRVDDDGPGLSPEMRERVLGRGVRLDEARPGHGLGLAIVADILRAWQGELTLEESPWGGLRVDMRLPPRAGFAADERAAPRPAPSAS